MQTCSDTETNVLCRGSSSCMVANS